MKYPFNKKIFFFLTLFFLLLIGGIELFKGIITENNNINISKLSYNSESQTPEVYYTKSQETLNEKLKIRKKNLVIKFNFILDKINAHDNIFQTSDDNQGIRLEFDKGSGVLYLVAKSENPDGTGFPLKAIEKGKEYSISISKKYNKNYKVVIDGENIPIAYNNDDYKVDNLVLGYGCVPDRVFNGKINQFSIDLSEKTVPVYWQNLVFIQAFLFLLWLIPLIFVNVKDSVINLVLTAKNNLSKYPACNILFVFVLAILIILPVTKISKQIVSASENRELAVYKPLISSEGINYNFGKDFDAWFSDRFFGRQLLMNINNRILYVVNRYYSLGSSSYSAFFNKKTKEAFLLPVRFYPVIKQEETNLCIEQIKRFNNFCKQNNINFYLLLAPAKNAIYHDRMYPYNLLPYGYDHDNAINEIAKQTNVTVIHPKQELIDARKDYETYFRTDHHWTDRGAYIGYKNLVTEIKKDFPNKNIPITPVSDFELKSYTYVKAGGSSYYPGQLIYGMLNIPSKYYNKILTFDYEYFYHKDLANLSISSENFNRNRVYKYKNAPNNLKVMAVGTSMTENLMEIFPYSFETTVFQRLVSSADLIQYKDKILKEKPDILILCFVDDNLPMMTNAIFGGF